MAQLYKKTGSCSRASGAQTDYPMYLVVGESNDAPLCFSPALWLDASDADSITIVSGKVSQWADKSGNARHAVQATADNQPVVGSETIDGKNTIRFDGSNDYLTVSSFPTGASAYSMYAVLKVDSDPPAEAQSGFLTFDGDSSLVSHYPYTDSKVYSDFATTIRKTVGNPSPSLTSAHLLNFDSAASLWACRINGTQIYTTATNTVGMSSATNDIGRSYYYFDGDFAEILIFPSVLSAQNRLIVEGYLAHKWGLESSLPTGHPYKTNAPVTASCDGHCKSDFGDIRFHDAADNALNYWIDWPTLTGTTPNQSVGVWVATDPGTSATDVVLKYGDSALTDASDGTAVFLKYKGFESGSDGDSIADADEDFTVISGTCEIDTAQKYSGTRSMRLVGASTNAVSNIAHTAESNAYAISLRTRKNDATNMAHPFFHGNNAKRISVFYTSSEDIKYYTGDAWDQADTGYNCAVDTWEKIEICNIDFSAGTFDIWFNGACIKSGAIMQNFGTSQDCIRCVNGTGSSGPDFWVDDLIVRKYASPEPTWGTWGEEELDA